MTRYATAVDLRRSLEARLKRQAEESGADYARLRRFVVFDRIAARLSASGREWVLKGGTCLEFRLGLRARATRDLDLALRHTVHGEDTLRDEIIESLAEDVDDDRFVFAVGIPTSLEPDAAGNPGWRFTVTSTLGGKVFDQVRMDVVLRGEELAATELITLPGTLAFAGVPARQIQSVDRRQHFAEKLHALTRNYGNRPNTRVKDLLDLLLLIGDGLQADTRLLDVAQHVFRVRATHPVPATIPDPPPAWTTIFPKLAADCDLSDQEIDPALCTLRAFWAQVIAPGDDS